MAWLGRGNSRRILGRDRLTSVPELPEVETVARSLDKSVAGDVIESVWLGSKPEPLKSPAAEIASTLQSRRIASVRRVGKHIVFDLETDSVARVPAKAGSNLIKSRSADKNVRPTHARSPDKSVRPTHARPEDKSVRPTHARPEDKSVRPTQQGPAQWIVHLGMTGRMLVCDPAEEVEKHTHAILRLSSGREMRFVDPRRFGRLSVSHRFQAPGAEPLEVEVEKFVDLFRGRKTPIKSALLNQNLLSGVGNIYADESLFRAGVRPRHRAASLSREQLRRLYLSVQEVLKEAIAAGGSSISDYVDANGEEGFFQLQHRVYGREGEPCLVCKTPVKRVVIAGRSSHYCPKCQR
jgi:formamidopyrimidine-DNA glycosylase